MPNGRRSRAFKPALAGGSSRIEWLVPATFEISRLHLRPRQREPPAAALRAREDAGEERGQAVFRIFYLLAVDRERADEAERLALFHQG